MIGMGDGDRAMLNVSVDTKSIRCSLGIGRDNLRRIGVFGYIRERS